MERRTLLQKTNIDGWPKPAELIEITGGHELEASDRAILNALYQHAHDSGRLGDPAAEWEVPLAHLRVSTHESHDRLIESLVRILRVVVRVRAPDLDGTPTSFWLVTNLFDGFMVPMEPGGGGAVRFRLPRDLAPLLARSNRWGRIRAEIVCEMTSKYAIALYEFVQLRRNLRRCVEVIPIDRFRELMGVPPKAYEQGSDFAKRVIEPAVLEVNGLSDMGVAVELMRRSKFAPIEAVTVTWWPKEGDKYRAAMRERNGSKAGRMARLRGQVEAVTPAPARPELFPAVTPPPLRSAPPRPELFPAAGLSPDMTAQERPRRRRRPL